MVAEKPKIDVNTTPVIFADYMHDRWINVPVNYLKELVDQGENVVLVDPTIRYRNIYAAFELEDLIGDADDLMYKTMDLPFEIEDQWDFDPYTAKLLSTFHYSWYNALRKYLHAPQFKAIVNKVATVRKVEPVYPAKENVFRIFKQDMRKIRGVWMGMSPYHTPGTANGISFATDQKAQPPSLQILEEGIRDALELGFLWKGLENSLQILSLQGIWLYNAALTTTADSTAHLELWRGFTIEVLKVLQVYNPGIEYVLYGKHAWSFENYITDKTYKLYHPSYYAHNKKAPEYQSLKEFFTTLNITFNG